MTLHFPVYKLPWPDPFIPAYKEVTMTNWRCRKTPQMGHMMGYWRPHNFVPSGWMFEQKQKTGWLKWMSLTPMELESHQPHIAAAKGTVVIAGLGMGFYLYNVLRKPEVNRVIVLEQEKSVVSLFERSIVRGQWNGLKKFELVMGDACKYKPTFEVDFLYADIWPYLGYQEALDITKQIQSNVNAKEVGFWGQEFDFCSWLMAQNGKKKLQHATLKDYNAFCEHEGLPLVERRRRIYPKLAGSAVMLQTAMQVKGESRVLLMAAALETLSNIAVLDELVKVG